MPVAKLPGLFRRAGSASCRSSPANAPRVARHVGTFLNAFGEAYLPVSAVSRHRFPALFIGQR
jgi:hypothetical protein